MVLLFLIIKILSKYLQESENKHEAADSDRAAIRSEVSATESALEASIETEQLKSIKCRS